MDLKKDENEKLNEFDKLNQLYKELKDKLTLITSQKQDNQETLQQVQRENDQIK